MILMCCCGLLHSAHHNVVQLLLLPMHGRRYVDSGARMRAKKQNRQLSSLTT